ncbi:MAG: CPBP family intramembrane metalloprotease [Bacilli bacterium]|nr:CPBP family intramembrane metalloprotease [Bacilli bacterium]
MKRSLEKYELFITIFLIVIYLLFNSICLNNFGEYSIYTFLCNLVLSLGIIIFILKNRLVKYYSLDSFPNPKKYLYFFPMILLIFVNFIGGVGINNTFFEILFYMLSMICVGFLEEIIFRGFLFKMMAKDSLKSAIIVTTITFGIGHILNLFNGADLIPTLVQICYAMAGGYLFVMILIKSKSLWPCIITHSLLNSLSIFGVGSGVIYEVVVPILLIGISLLYVRYIKKLKL